MDTIFISTLLNTPKISKKTVKYVLNTIKYDPADTRELLDVLIEAKQSASRIHVPQMSDLESAYNKAVRDMEECEKAGIKVLGMGDEGFPVRLRTIPDPPVILYIKGNYKFLNEQMAVAIIGTRNPTPHGEKVAEKMGSVFGEKGFVVVSGLALGCDSAAHTGCIDAGGKTVAILAHGLHMVYPSKNKALANKIIESGGCLISEYPIGVNPFSSYFVERDRLQSGLSSAVVVAETDIKGGTMHTVQYCIDQNRNLGCYQHDQKYLELPQTKGNQMLISQGKAIPLKSQDDIEKFICEINSQPVKNPETRHSSLDNSITMEQISMPGLDKIK